MTKDNKIQQEIAQSIQQYQNLILNDINLGVRLVDEDGKLYISELSKWEKDDIIFGAPLEQRDWVAFPLPINLEIRFITKQTVLAAEIKLTSRNLVNDKLFYTGQLISPLTKKQQRAHFRIEALLDMKYRVLPENQKMDESLETLPLEEGQVINMSAGGMCIVCAQQLNKEQCIQIHFNFLERDFQLYGKILALGEKNTSNTYTHRMSFIYMDSEQENLLSKLIFEKQRLSMQAARQPLYKK